MTNTISTDAVLIGADELESLVQVLRGHGRTVIGPVVRNGVVAHDTIESASELPRGWTEEQEGGTYRLIASGNDQVFGFSSPSESWKRFLFPARTLLVRATRSNGETRIDAPSPSGESVAFFGVRSCDLAALGVTDRIFLDPDATDPTYASQRAELFIVAVACANPAPTCFCASMDTGPSPRTGFDLSIAELDDDDGHDFLVWAGSEAGAAVLGELEGRDPTSRDENRRAVSHETAVAAMTRSIRPEDPPAAARSPEHPQWSEVARRCLACGNCTMVCPTCFCSTTEDSTNLAGTEAERWRVWDSCFTLDHSYMHGGSVRTTTQSQYRQWLLHKLVTWYDQFDVSGCVGCGRCITWCPVGIDLTAEIAALAKPVAESAPIVGSAT